MQNLEQLRREQPVAYFSMEIALEPAIPTYSGGLGVLAGDLVRTAADLGVPLVAITLASRKGYFRQALEATGSQREEPSSWDPAARLELIPAKVSVSIEGRDVAIQAWVCDCSSVVGRATPVLFLDTNLPENHPDDRAITDSLYGGDAIYRLKQEVVLGIGGVRILKALGLPIRKYHMNEGHSALLVLELLRELPGSFEARRRALRELCVFTTHTPVESGHDRFARDLVERVVGDAATWSDIAPMSGDRELNMTLLGLNASGFVNGVAERHRETSAAMFPGHRIFAITNGVHSHTWTSPSFRAVFDAYLPGWAAEPMLLARFDIVPEHRIWEAHLDAKRDLVAMVRSAAGVDLDVDALTIGIGRRFTPYKRNDLLLSDLGRLRRIARRGPLQIVYAGKAHPHDEAGKRIIGNVFRAMRELDGDVRVAFLPEYDIATAKKLVAGVDVWLNTPQPPMEASGTSGMKAAHNGVLNFSVLDGWWIEGCLEGVTGWSIGPHPKERKDPAACAAQELEDMYGKLEYVILPMYYGQRGEWVHRMKEVIDDVASYFNAHRMLRRYVTDAYFRRGS